MRWLNFKLRCLAIEMRFVVATPQDGKDDPVDPESSDNGSDETADVSPVGPADEDELWQPTRRRKRSIRRPKRDRHAGN